MTVKVKETRGVERKRKGEDIIDGLMDDVRPTKRSKSTECDAQYEGGPDSLTWIEPEMFKNAKEKLMIEEKKTPMGIRKCFPYRDFN